MKVLGISGVGPTAAVVFSVAIMLFCGFAMTRLTKRVHLPDVTAYLVAGMLIGPFGFSVIPGEIVTGTEFLADIAIAIIAFGTGEFFRVSALKKNGIKVVCIGLLDCALSVLLVYFVTRYALSMENEVSVLLAALAPAVSPASTVLTIRRSGARGDFVDTLLQVVALDDILGLLGFGMAVSAIASAGQMGNGTDGVMAALAVNFLVMLSGGAVGVILKVLLPQSRSRDNRLIILVASLFAFCGFCSELGVSPLLGCMSMGAVYVNITGDEALSRQLDRLSPPILLLFFVRSGMSLRLDCLLDAPRGEGTVPLLVVSFVYCLVRAVAKYCGAFVGSLAVRKERRVGKYLGFALIPQASVAIGLMVIGARTLGGVTGETLTTIVVTSGVLYELVGPACAKMALHRSGSCETQNAEEGTALADSLAE